MNMKQSKIILAYKSLEGIRASIAEKKDTPSNISFIFYRVYKLLQPQFEFQQEEEKKIFSKYETEDSENGQIKFKNINDAESFLKDINDLGDMDVDLDFEKIKFKIDDNSYLTPDDLIALEPFLDYVE